MSEFIRRIEEEIYDKEEFGVPMGKENCKEPDINPPKCRLQERRKTKYGKPCQDDYDSQRFNGCVKLAELGFWRGPRI